MIALWYCSTSWCQSKVLSQDSSTGGCDSALVAMSAIRAANIKLIEAKADKQLKEQFKKLVELQREQIVILNKNIDSKNKIIIDLTNQVNDNNSKVRKLKRQRNIYAGSSIGLSALIVLILSL